MQNWLPSATKNTYREEDWDLSVLLKACDEPAASQLHPDRAKIYQNIIFSIKFCSRAPRLEFSHIGNLLVF